MLALGLATRAFSTSLMQPIWKIVLPRGFTMILFQQSPHRGLLTPGAGLPATQTSCEEVQVLRRTVASIHHQAATSWPRTPTLLTQHQRMVILMLGWRLMGKVR